MINVADGLSDGNILLSSAQTDGAIQYDGYARGNSGRAYYVDATAGNNANSGSISAPLQTLAAVSALALKPGDRVLFKRGETWRGQHLTIPASGQAGRCITFGAYGSGANPIIDPTASFADWTDDGSNIWKRTDAGQAISQVFQDGARMIYAAAKAGMPAGAFAYVLGVVYVRCTDDGNPNSGHVIDYRQQSASNDIAVRLNGKAHLIFDSLDITKHDVAYNTNLTGTVDVTIRNCTISWGNGRSIVIGCDIANTADLHISDVTISNVVGHDDLDVTFWVGFGTRLNVIDCETYNSGLDCAPRAKNYPISGDGVHYPTGIMVSKTATDCIVRGNYVHDIYGGPGIMSEYSLTLRNTGTIIEGNLVDNRASAATAGIKVETINTIVRNNLIYTGAESAIVLANTPVTPVFYHNTIISASGAAHSIDCGGMPNATFKNNIVVRAGATNRYISVTAPAQTGFVCNNNLYYGASTERWFWGPTEYTSMANWRTNSSKDAQGVNADPVFVTANTNLHLQVTSPAIGAGDATVGVLTDYDGVARGAAVDIGCYEFQA